MRWLFLGALVLLLVIVVAGFVYQGITRANRNRELSAIFGNSFDTNSAPVGFAAGELIETYDSVRKEFHTNLSYVPSDLMAIDTAQIGYILVVETTTGHVSGSKYWHNAPQRAAYYDNCHLSLIHAATWEVLATKDFQFWYHKNENDKLSGGRTNGDINEIVQWVTDSYNAAHGQS